MTDHYPEMTALFEELKIAIANLQDDARVFCHIIQRFTDLAQQHDLASPVEFGDTAAEVKRFLKVFDDMARMLEGYPK